MCPRLKQLLPEPCVLNLQQLDALAVSSDVPVVSCDARNRESTKNVLISLVEYVLTMRRTRAVAPA